MLLGLLLLSPVQPALAASYAGYSSFYGSVYAANPERACSYYVSNRAFYFWIYTRAGWRRGIIRPDLTLISCSRYRSVWQFEGSYSWAGVNGRAAVKFYNSGRHLQLILKPNGRGQTLSYTLERQ